MPTVAYLDCFAGVSGDMLLGALIDAGLPLPALREELAKLGIEGYALEAVKVRRAGLAATLLQVHIEEGAPHRSATEMIAVVRRSGLPDGDREKAVAVLERLAEVESAVHGASPESIELHELGSPDTLVDIVGTVVGLRLLKVEELFASPLPPGSGFVKTAHGTLPVPAPATLAIMTRAGAPLASAEWQGEVTTPTGAAIITTLAKFERPLMRLTGLGYGAGSRDPEDHPNVLRLWLGERAGARGAMLLLETNVDDMTGEVLGYVQERLFAAGAADVWFTPIQMKKNRPAVKLSVLCPSERESEIVALLLEETSTLGVRTVDVRRHEAQRETFQFASSLGQAIVKVKRLGGRVAQAAPEYEACRRLAQETGLPLIEVYRIVQAEALAEIEKRRRPSQAPSSDK
ncbi:MAG: nickel pincer cofactor biosynthesis protein LarC [Dehalococcoidia bacterium]|nr:nickel pincer cofactor biosynthesis protein LarC [Dehalococcoidia bacterium]